MNDIAKTPEPPYFAVIFTTIRTVDDNGYAVMSRKMVELAALQKGFLGMESLRDELGITISYWETEEDIINWKNNIEHLLAQKQGKEVWYKAYKTRICKVERDYGFEK